MLVGRWEITHICTCFGVHLFLECIVLFSFCQANLLHLLLCSGSNCCARQYLGPSRPFEMTITDNMQREVSFEGTKW